MLFGVEFDVRPTMDAGPMKLTLVQPARRQPDTDAVVHQHFHAVGPAVGKEVSAVRLCRTEYRDHSGQCRLSAGTPGGDHEFDPVGAAQRA